MDIGALIRKITARVHPAAYIFIPVLKVKDRLGEGHMHKVLADCIELYTTPEQRADKRGLRRTKRDMWYSFLLYHTDFEEYFLFRFPRLSHAGRREFVPLLEKNELCERMSPPEVQARIWDKWAAYELFRPYYHRDAVAPQSESDYEAFARFVEEHPRFMAKPRLTSCGEGVSLCDTTAEGTDVRALFDRFLREGFICEEVISQAEPMASLHPSSVNTVRAATYVKNGAPEVVFTNVRVGQGGSIVDNAGAGGFVAAIDVDTGVVMTPGTSKALERVLFHPDTGTQIIGFHIPEWEKLKAMVREAAMTYPVHPYISWDCAYTPDGWVIVEANCMGQVTGAQYSTEHGLRSRMSLYFDM